MTETQERRPYRWFSPGDFNGFFGLMFDNLTVLSFLSGILILFFQYPADIVYKKMFPGTAFGVLFGDMVYTWMAFRLARRTNNPNVTAMPLGLDTPSTIGVAFTVLGPCFVAMKDAGMSPETAAIQTWYVGMATMVLIGVIKLGLSFTGNFLQRLIPQAGLLGSLAGIGLALIGFIPMVEIFGAPVVGMVALGLILYNLVARIRLPGNFPGVAASVLAGTALYYVLAPAGLTGGVFAMPKVAFHLGFPTPNLGFLSGFQGAVNAFTYLPIAIPFAILTVVGGINVTESARVGGDDYSTRDILLTEAVATLIAGICGGVAQSTPYIGQPAYKAMGSRAGYTLLTGLFIGLGGIFGYISFFVEMIPKCVLAPILIFVALDIMVQAFLACPARHAPAVGLAYIPTVARLVQIKTLGLLGPVGGIRYGEWLAETVPGFGHSKVLNENVVTYALGNGFILTAMLWGAFAACLIDRKLRQAAAYLLVLACLTFFGIVHSVDPDGRMYAPWDKPAPAFQLSQYLQSEPEKPKPTEEQLQAAARQIPYQFTLAYLVMAGMMLAFSFTPESKEPFPEDELGHG
ncbi:MAG: hypothetical protein AB1758_02710 [Candidatus Eremiobacterota bacterium]